MTDMYLIRHGQTDWNLQNRWQGHIDIPLNSTGILQVQRMAQALLPEGIHAIYSSDLMRARQTAQALADALALEVQFDPRLREINQGEWQGMSGIDIRQRYEMAYQAAINPNDFAPPGGESLTLFRDRLVVAMWEIAGRHPGQHVAVVTHGFAVGIILAHFKDLPLIQAWEMIPSNEERRILQL